MQTRARELREREVRAIEQFANHPPIVMQRAPQPNYQQPRR